MTTIASVNILGIAVSSINIHQAIEQIGDWIRNNDRQYVCVASVHPVVVSQFDDRLRKINNQAGMVTPDGIPLVWLCRLYGHPDVSRVYGPDLLLACCARSLETGWSHYFYGGKPGVAERLIACLIERFPGLKIAGYESPPFRPLSDEEDEKSVSNINASGADIVWVGLGAPKQEYWMSDHLGRVNSPVMIGIGAAFDFISGVTRQAPRWMQRIGLEWFFRLASEPKRLLKRYLFIIPVFLILIILQVLRIKNFPIEENNKTAIHTE